MYFITTNLERRSHFLYTLFVEIHKRGRDTNCIKKDCPVIKAYQAAIDMTGGELDPETIEELLLSSGFDRENIQKAGFELPEVGFSILTEIRGSCTAGKEPTRSCGYVIFEKEFIEREE